ncbi:MAG: type II toxin-antitoxin system VapC family toxin [Anaerolineales bacterium]|jgi:predicted nucleic acid-binding protein
MIVADTNLILYLHIRGDLSSLALQILQKDSRWITHPLWQSEFRNALAGYMRRGMSLEVAQAIMKDALQVMEERQVIPDSDRVLALAAHNSCTAYDCEFVALAEQLGIPLVTADKQLIKAFPNIAISLEDFVA